MGIRLCSLSSGSSGNCIFVGNGNSGLLVDCGISGKEALSNLNRIGICSSAIKAVVVTHEHSDHIKGVGIISRKLGIPVYANINTWNSMGALIGAVKPEHIRCFAVGEELEVAGIGIKSYSIPHDAADPVGFCFYEGNKKISIATDLGYFSDTVKENISGSDMIMLESNHDIEMLMTGRYPFFLKRRILSEQGHLSNEAAGNAVYELIQTGVREVLLGHLSKENNFPELAYETVKGILEQRKVKINVDIKLDLAPRNGISRCYNID
ncbi:MAG: MBL fold metallo-hydrolase [Clostridiaceae bacterium]|jgi:phosphoribosyl 1,2-cyclic phosphodiesterase|nr:MBL fold metallo-hydrolase [Clostridiaceae bacterium]